MLLYSQDVESYEKENYSLSSILRQDGFQVAKILL